MRPAWRRKVCSSKDPAADADSLPEEFSDFDGAMFEVRVIERPRHGFFVIGGFDQIKATQDLFRFAVWAVGRAGFASGGTEHLTGIFSEPLGGLHKRLLSPGCVLFEGPLH